jgi:two-component system, chemotaxis family, sensor kinase Cph1
MIPLDLISQVKQRIATLTDPEMAVADLALTNCDREPIHISSAIQAHGVLLTFTATDLIILQVSQNSADFLHKAPADLLGKSLSVLLTTPQIQAIQDCLNGEFDRVNPLQLNIEVGNQTAEFVGIVHASDGVVLLELERSCAHETTSTISPKTTSFFDFYKFVKSPIDRIQRTQDLAELSQQAVQIIRNTTGFDSP